MDDLPIPHSHNSLTGENDMNLKIEQIDFHHNGVSGVPFHAVLFRDVAKKQNMVAIVLEQETVGGLIPVFVFNRDMLVDPEAGVTFGKNSWRGDYYAPQLREAIKIAFNGV